MTNEAARAILEKMLDGLHPVTGETLPPDHLCNTPDVIRALHVAVSKLTSSGPTQVNAGLVGKLSTKRPWTQADNDLLISLYQSGASVQEMAQKLQRRQRGIERQLSELNLTADEHQPIPGKERAGTRWTEDDDNLLVFMYTQHMPIDCIAHQLKRSEYSIFCHMEKLQLYGTEHGYPQKDVVLPWTHEDSRLLRELYKSGKTVSELAEYFGRNEKNISARLFYLGLSKESPLPPLPRLHKPDLRKD